MARDVLDFLATPAYLTSPLLLENEILLAIAAYKVSRLVFFVPFVF
jgi:hypothetical protein